MALIKCPECSNEISDKALKCPKCGFAIQDIVICEECGTRNKKGSKSCISCGYPFEEIRKCSFCDNGILDENEYCNSCGMDNKVWKNNEEPIVEDTVFYKKPTSNLPKREEPKRKNRVIWIFIAVLCLFGGCGACMGESSDVRKEVEDSPENYSSYDEYVEAQKIVSDDVSIEEESETQTEEENETNIDLTIGTDIPKEEYIELCQEYDYKDVLRNPSDYVGQKVKVTIEISSVHEESWLNDTKYYFGYTEGQYGYYTGDRYGIFDCRQGDNLKLLSEDVITVYGEITNPEYTSSFIVNSEELFCINMYYVDLIDE